MSYSVRHINPIDGIQVKILDLKSLPGEISEIMVIFLVYERRTAFTWIIRTKYLKVCNSVGFI